MGPPAESAGLLLFRRRSGPGIEVMLVHMGGPLWARREARAWSIPKGGAEPGETPLQAARREFSEELGQAPPEGTLTDLGEIRQSAGKIVRAWALEGDMEAGEVSSSTFKLEWPPRSGRLQEFPEVDRSGWFSPEQARSLIVARQSELIDRLLETLADPSPAYKEK